MAVGDFDCRADGFGWATPYVLGYVSATHPVLEFRLSHAYALF